MNRPLCECHGEPMTWRPRRDRASGGQWNCSIRLKITQDRYNRSQKGLSRSKVYKTTDKGRRNTRVQQGRRTFRARAGRIRAIEEELSHR